MKPLFYTIPHNPSKEKLLEPIKRGGPCSQKKWYLKNSINSPSAASSPPQSFTLFVFLFVGWEDKACIVK